VWRGVVCGSMEAWRTLRYGGIKCGGCGGVKGCVEDACGGVEGCVEDACGGRRGVRCGGYGSVEGCDVWKWRYVCTCTCMCVHVGG